MKLFKKVTIVILAMFIMLFSIASSPLPGKGTNRSVMDITLSHHDFSGASWSGGEICRVCHTPHNASLDVAGSPLWNHETTVATFEVYTSSTMQGVTGQPIGKT